MISCNIEYELEATKTEYVARDAGNVANATVCVFRCVPTRRDFFQILISATTKRQSTAGRGADKHSHYFVIVFLIRQGLLMNIFFP